MKQKIFIAIHLVEPVTVAKDDDVDMEVNPSTQDTEALMIQAKEFFGNQPSSNGSVDADVKQSMQGRTYKRTVENRLDTVAEDPAEEQKEEEAKEHNQEEEIVETNTDTEDDIF